MILSLLLALVFGAVAFDDPPPQSELTVTVKLDDGQEVEIAGLVEALADATGIKLQIPGSRLSLPTAGLSGTLTRKLLEESLGTGASVDFQADKVQVKVSTDRLAGKKRTEWEKRLNGLVARIADETKRRSFYGLYARESYRANDPRRPTVCLIHGMNSTSSVFLHMVAPLEKAGYGVVVYDFPYNRDVDETVIAFRKDWRDFRTKAGEKQPWAIVSHSMGALLARDLVEGPEFKNDVASLIMIAPVNGGSYLAKAQTALQLVQGVQSLNGKTRSDPIGHLADGMGAAADDLTPGSPILKRLEGYPRRTLPYHILAGDSGFISEAVRTQIISRLGVLARVSGPGLVGQLDELTDGRGDGCVAVERTRLAGVGDFHVLHANHLELIRAPLLYPDPGPVVSMPFVLKWLATDLPPRP